MPFTDNSSVFMTRAFDWLGRGFKLWPQMWIQAYKNIYFYTHKFIGLEALFYLYVA